MKMLNKFLICLLSMNCVIIAQEPPKNTYIIKNDTQQQVYVEVKYAPLNKEKVSTKCDDENFVILPNEYHKLNVPCAIDRLEITRHVDDGGSVQIQGAVYGPYEQGGEFHITVDKKEQPNKYALSKS